MQSLPRGYRDYVDPTHPVLKQVFGQPCPKPQAALTAALETLRRDFVYRPDRGRTELDEFGRWLENGAPSPAPINCIDLSCLLVSYLRASGCSENDVFVVLGDTPSPKGLRSVDLHSVVLARADAGWKWIDPIEMRSVDREGDEILADGKLHMIFNDQRVYMLPREQERLLCRSEPSTGLQILLYGSMEPDFEALLADLEFRRVVAALFEGHGVVAAGEEWERRDQAVYLGLVTPGPERLEPGPRLALVSREVEFGFRNVVDVALDRYLGLVAAAVPALRRAYAGCAASRSFAWAEVEHAVVAGMLLDLAVGAKLDLAKEVDGLHGGTVLWAFEHISAANGFGVRWFCDPPHPYGLAQLWHRRVERPPVAVRADTLRELIELSLGRRTGLTTPSRLYLRHARLLSGSGDATRIDVPVFPPSDAARLLEPLMEFGERIVREVVEPAFALAGQLHGTAKLRRSPSWRQVGTRLLLEYITDRAIDAGLLSPFPAGDRLPVSWGRWLWVPDEAAPRLASAPSSATAE